MSETLKTPDLSSEGNGFDDGVEARVPPFDPQAATEARQKEAIIQSSPETTLRNQSDLPTLQSKPSTNLGVPNIEKSPQERANDCIQEALKYYKGAISGETRFSLKDGSPIEPEEQARLATIEMDKARQFIEEAKKAEEARLRRIEEYKKIFPDAIEDVDKAHYMAQAGDKLEFEAAVKESRAVKNVLNTKFYPDNDSIGEGMAITPEGELTTRKHVQEDLSRDIATVNAIRARANTAEDIAGAFYDEVIPPKVPEQKKQNWLARLKKRFSKH